MGEIRTLDFQEQFAERVDISVDFVSLVERGINAPSFDVLEKMARVLKVPVVSLFGKETKRQ